MGGEEAAGDDGRGSVVRVVAVATVDPRVSELHSLGTRGHHLGEHRRLAVGRHAAEEVGASSGGVELAEQPALAHAARGLHLDACLEHPERCASGSASCRERVCQYVSISVVADSLKKKHKYPPN